MPQQHYIRFLREAEGCSIRDIARQMGIHWRTESLGRYDQLMGVS
ncbi:hypothetical protein ABU162_26665 [Paenibacillus thiaminolyticus]